MEAEPLDVRELIHTVWELRQASLYMGEASGTQFLCPNCEEMKPFAGEIALGHYTTTGVSLVCNECLLDFRMRRGIDRVRPM